MAFRPHALDRERATLALGSTPLGHGTSGVITRLEGGEKLLYKEYAPRAGRVNGTALADLVESGHRDPELRSRCSWPMARVVDGDQVTGFLMREAAGGFHRTVGAELDLATRHDFAVQAAELVLHLHGKGWIVGNLSIHKILWRHGEIFLVGCDGLRRHGAEPVVRPTGISSVDDPWQPPTGPDFDTDRYRLALLIGRTLSGDPAVRPGEPLFLDPGFPDRVSSAVSEMFARAGGPRGGRPAASEWLQSLSGRKRIAVSRPLLGGVRAGVLSDSVPEDPESENLVFVTRDPEDSEPEIFEFEILDVEEDEYAVVVEPVAEESPDLSVPAESLGRRVIDSPVYAEQRELAPRTPVDDVTVAFLVTHVADGNGRASVADLARLLGEEPSRMVMLLRSVRGLLNVEQTEVITLKDNDRTVVLNVPLLEEQFLEEDEP
ncbi:hypothetical protein FDA94_16985 [Herbidospora galbida]|uniref:Alkaline phosphatase-like protein PglZ C-terminal domain-containing protein n=1 Tax=Herbidospora galbida TaxID=2575442 RepID=A0A4U3MGD5_9ACTN|nr:hypothetical protein [Herbidospora galbida]TKK87522.1 hypothetical protein FDA94_16985 [Herbidospora galbida]